MINQLPLPKLNFLAMKKIALFLICLIFGFNLSAQTQGVAYTAVGKGVATTFLTDYQCLGINPSALGWGTGYEKKKWTTGSSEFAFGMYSDVLTSDKLKNFSSAIWSSIKGDTSKSFDWAKQRSAVAEYAQAGVSVFADYNWGGISFQGKIFGGIAFNVHENYQFYSKLNQKTTDAVINGRYSSLFDSLTLNLNGIDVKVANTGSLSPDSMNAVVSGTMSVPLHLSSLLNGSSIKMSWNRSFNLGYGRKVFGIDSVVEIFAGVGGRLIKSMAMFEMDATAQGITMYSSLSPVFNINYQDILTKGKSLLNYSGGIPPAVGSGYGVDLSASALLFGRFRVAMSVNNLGSVTYDRNVYRVKDTLVTTMQLNGLSDVNLTKSVNQLISKGGLLSLEGTEKYKLTNAANFRFGASYHYKQRLGIGFDLVAPFDKENPGSIKNAVISFGGDIRIFKWLQLSAGYYGGGIYKDNIPVGINFIKNEGSYEFGIASRDILTFFNKNTHNLSFAMGFARFRF
jgi:hypothetical protein